LTNIPFFSIILIVREKRLATILYADLTGFTELTSTLGPERIAEFVNECFRTLDSIIHIHDGTVLRHEGDRVMAIFGFPKSHGYDSYSAVLSGLRILEATKEITQSMGTHLGIATGEVICEDGNVYGPVIDTASLLEEKAPVGEIFIDKNCYELNKNFFDCERLLENNNEFYKILTEKKIKRQYENQFLDRKDEFTKLRDLIFRSEKLIFVTGEPGVGKTRFVIDTVEKINQDSNRYNFLQTSFLTTKSRQSYEPILKIVRALKPDFKPDSGVDLVSEAYNVKIHNQLGEAIFSASKIKPLILHLQYFDRVDKISLKFFKFLVNNIENRNTILIFEMHEISKSILDTLQSVAKSTIQTIALPQLEQTIQIKIASELLSEIDVSETVLKQITRCAGGNPLFLSELCSYITQMHSTGITVDQIKIPYRLKEMFNHLIDHIPQDILTTLSTAAIYGYKVERNSLDAIIPDNNDAIKYALANRIVETNDGDIAFVNPFFRDELCNRIPESLKKEIHRRIATTLREHISGPDIDKKLAYHFRACTDYEPALHYGLRWAKKMKDMHATDSAIAAYTEALDITKKSDGKAERSILVKRVELLNLAGRKEEEKADLGRLAEIVNQENEEELYEFLLAKGRYLESVCEYDEAIKLYDGYPDKEKRVKVLERLGMVYYCKGQFSKTIETLAQALALARKNYRSLKDTRAISTILISKFSKL